MTIQIEIQNAKSTEIINAIKLLKGVKNIKEPKPEWSKADEKAWKMAKQELKKGEALSPADLERIAKCAMR